MSGFVGVRAKKRKRNIIIFFILILIFFLFFYLLPTSKLNKIMPSNTLLPSDNEITSPEIKLTIEDLENRLFDREQKIIFRNNEINKIKKELKILIKENTQLSNSIQDLKNQSSLTLLSSEEMKNNNKEIEKIRKDNKKEVQKLNDIILKITNENNDLFKNIEKINSKNELAKKEYKVITNQNKELTSSKKLLDKKIKEQIDAMDELKLSIQTLKDNYHHR